MNKNFTKNIHQTFVALLLAAALSGCQTGTTPHPFTTMFDRKAPEHGITHAVHQENFPETLTAREVKTADSTTVTAY